VQLQAAVIHQLQHLLLVHRGAHFGPAVIVDKDVAEGAGQVALGSLLRESNGVNECWITYECQTCVRSNRL
jgi:hypothetical protein